MNISAIAVPGLSLSPGRHLVTRFDASDLGDSDFAGVEARGGKLEATTRRYRTAIRTVAFDGARMDKLTYAGLKAMGADLSDVTAA